ncbi:hypothetical protein TNCV_4897071 [Trichonephila clavipes]|nr:hypothetical protein TNCV_4897071 [Trichonephila clavipes]
MSASLTSVVENQSTDGDTEETTALKRQESPPALPPKGVARSFNKAQKMNTLQRLLMVTWNANGLRSRMWELRDFVNKYKPDVISLQETWLRPSHTIALANYRIYRNDRNHTTHNAYTARTGGEANTPEDIDEQIAAFTDRLHQAYKNASKPLKHNDTFYISRDLNQLFKERNRARKIWHYTRSPADKNTLNRLQKQIKKIVIKHEQKQWDESLACLEAEDSSLWKAARDSGRRLHKFRPLKALPKLHLVTQTKVRS